MSGVRRDPDFARKIGGAEGDRTLDPRHYECSSHLGTKEHGWAQENHANFTRACGDRGKYFWARGDRSRRPRPTASGSSTAQKARHGSGTFWQSMFEARPVRPGASGQQLFQSPLDRWGGLPSICIKAEFRAPDTECPRSFVESRSRAAVRWCYYDEMSTHYRHLHQALTQTPTHTRPDVWTTGNELPCVAQCGVQVA
jgi:hypothetical protein